MGKNNYQNVGMVEEHAKRGRKHHRPIAGPCIKKKTGREGIAAEPTRKENGRVGGDTG